MRKSKLVGVATLVAVVCCFGLLLSSAADKKGGKEKKRSASTKQLMKGLVGFNCGALSKALKAKETDWDEVALRAAMLNEGGHCLMDDGRCPDGDWSTGAKTVQKCSAVILDLAAKKDLSGAQDAFKVLTSKGCKTCHAKHKK
jgi:cytochrome c556